MAIVYKILLDSPDTFQRQNALESEKKHLENVMSLLPALHNIGHQETGKAHLSLCNPAQASNRKDKV